MIKTLETQFNIADLIFSIYSIDDQFSNYPVYELKVKIPNKKITILISETETVSGACYDAMLWLNNNSEEYLECKTKK